MYTVQKGRYKVNYPYKLTMNIIIPHNKYNITTTHPFLYKSASNNLDKINSDKVGKNKYMIRLAEDKRKTFKRIQKEKIDLLLDKAYDRYQNNIRTYEFNMLRSPTTKKNYELLPKITRNRLTTEILAKSEKLFPKKYLPSQTTSNFHPNKRPKDYNQLYKIRYANRTLVGNTLSTTMKINVTEGNRSYRDVIFQLEKTS